MVTLLNTVPIQLQRKEHNRKKCTITATENRKTITEEDRQTFKTLRRKGWRFREAVKDKGKVN